MSEDNLSKTNYFSDGDTSDSDYEGDKNFDEIYRYICPNCSKRFITKPSLNKHQFNFHEQNAEINKSSASDQYSETSSQKEYVHEEPKLNIPVSEKENCNCPYCEKLFEKRLSLTNHISTVHAIGFKTENSNKTKNEFNKTEKSWENTRQRLASVVCDNAMEIFRDQNSQESSKETENIHAIWSYKQFS